MVNMHEVEYFHKKYPNANSGKTEVYALRDDYFRYWTGDRYDRVDFLANAKFYKTEKSVAKAMNYAKSMYGLDLKIVKIKIIDMSLSEEIKK